MIRTLKLQSHHDIISHMRSHLPVVGVKKCKQQLHLLTIKVFCHKSLNLHRKTGAFANELGKTAIGICATFCWMQSFGVP